MAFGYDATCICTVGVCQLTSPTSVEQGENARVEIPVRRSYKICKAASEYVVQNVLGVADLPAHSVVGEAGELRVVVSVLGDLMALAQDPARRIVIGLGAHSKLEEGRLNAPRRKTVEQALCIRSGAVVKGQRDQLLLPIRRRSRHRQERQQAADRQKQGDPFLQLLHFLFLHLLLFL